jgi:SAM-dependent methyltransferase/uncharacterized protein YbaR (Trm112 family)
VTVTGVPSWLTELAVCPADRGPLAVTEGGVRCLACGREHAVLEGIVELLPERLAHLGGSGGGPPADASAEVAWVSDEMDWWNPYHVKDAGPPAQPDQGLRGRSRERNLLRHVRDRVGPRPAVAEMGAGSSRTMAGLWPPRLGSVRYVATDLSRVGLRLGAPVRGDLAAAVQCDAGDWPFRDDSLDVVMILGVLHHLPDWERSLRRACRSVRPGGFVLLHEVVWKPRILAGRRTAGVNEAWTSPHEGHVTREHLRRELESTGRVLRWRLESSPLRFALLHYLNLHERLEHSRAMTVALDVLDQAFGRTLGRLRPSLGFAEVMCVWQRPQAASARSPRTSSGAVYMATAPPGSRGHCSRGRSK